MAKLAQAFAKYLIHAKLNASAVVEKPDIIGAIFGQTEGLLGADLDLRELQRTGRIGRIEVDIKSSKGKSQANVLIPSSLDASETALIAASLETIEKVGPCEATIEITGVEDVRGQKRQYVIDRAKEILRGIMETGTPNSQKISESIKQAVRSFEITDYKGLSCGSGIFDSDEIIVVEGRADVINLLKNGIKNVIAIEGSNIPEPILDLTKRKITTAFIDGDRGGELDFKKLLDLADIDFVARAENGKEVEELSKKEIYKSLRERIPVDQISIQMKDMKNKPKSVTFDNEKIKFLSSLLDDILGTRAAYLIDSRFQIISKIPVNEMANILGDFKNVYAIVFDGKITQSIVDLALQCKVSCLVGMGMNENVKHSSLKIFTMDNIKLA